MDALKQMKIKLDAGAFAPVREHSTDAGMDLRSMEDKTVLSYSSETFSTGVHVELPKGTAGLLVSKSGLNVNRDLTSTGLIDEGYTGEIKVKLYNHGAKDQKIHKGDKISQLVIIPVRYEDIEIVDELSDSERGSDGFGSTGR